MGAVRTYASGINPAEHTGLVRHAVKRYLPFGDLDDLLQAGCLGLIRAAEKFEPERGFAFSTYARFWIAAFVRRHIDANRTIHIPQRTLEAMRAAGEPLPREPASMDVMFARLRERGEGDVSRHDVIADGAPSPEDDAATAEQAAAVRAAVATLPERLREVVRLRFFEEETLEQIGTRFGITRERVRQIEADALVQLRRKLERP